MTGMDGSANRSAWKQTKAGKKNTMGKWHCFQTILQKSVSVISCIGILCGLCACSATELEDRCFPMMAIADVQEERIRFAYGFPELSQKDNTDMEEANVGVPLTEGGNFAEALTAYEKELSNLGDCNHMKVFVIGESLLQDRARLGETLDYLRESEVFPRNSYVCVTGDIEALLKLTDSLPEDEGSYLETFLQNHESDHEIELTNLGTLLDEQINKRLDLELPYVAVEKDTIVWTRNVEISFAR